MAFYIRIYWVTKYDLREICNCELVKNKIYINEETN